MSDKTPEKNENKPNNVPLTREEQHRITALIMSWKTKFTWLLLVKAVEDELSIETTRQTLQTYTGIKNAYDGKKQEFRGVSPTVINRITSSDEKLALRIDRLEAEIKVKQDVIDKQLALIKLIYANASEIPNLDPKDLVRERND